MDPIKREPSTESNANPSSLPLIPSLPHIGNNAANPFGPSSSSSASSSYKSIPPPFSSNPMAPFAPSFGHSYPPHSPYSDRNHNPYTHPLSNAMNPMFYAPVFGQQPPWNQSAEYEQTSSDTPPSHHHHHHSNNNHKKSNKQYSFTPGMQPGAYYLIPLNTPNGHSSAHQPTRQPMAAYMPLINATKQDKNSENEECEKNSNSNSSTNSSPSSSSSNQSQSEQLNYLNMISPKLPHLPFPHIPLTPTSAPLPLSSYHDFTLAPIANTNNAKIEDKKPIISAQQNKNASKHHSVFMMNSTPINSASQSLSFPPLPTNDSLATNSNVNHLNSPFAENERVPPMLTDDIDSSSDQDMDIALGIMPIIDSNTNNSQNTKQQKHKICAKKLAKKTRKHINKKK